MNNLKEMARRILDRGIRSEDLAVGFMAVGMITAVVVAMLLAEGLRPSLAMFVAALLIACTIVLAAALMLLVSALMISHLGDVADEARPVSTVESTPVVRTTITPAPKRRPSWATLQVGS